LIEPENKDWPLKGVRVLDMSRVLAGPWAGQIFADLGADVIKVEQVGKGDDTRRWGPPFLRDLSGQPTSESGYYLSTNRGKRSIALDISTAGGQAVVRRLAKQSDVLIENFKVGGLAKYGLDFHSLHKHAPQLIYLSITGFGQTGPYAHRAGYDLIIQAMGGLMSVTGRGDDEPGAGPQKVGVAVSDLCTGMYGVIGVLAALHQRQKTGLGQQVDMSLLDSTVALMSNQNTNWLFGDGEVPNRRGNRHPSIVPYQDFETKDGHIILAVGNDSQYRALAEVVGDDRLLHADYASNPMRVRHRDVLVPLIQQHMRHRTTEEWATVLEAVGVPCGPINSLDKVFADEQVKARELKVMLDHPLGGQIPSVLNPIRLSASTTGAQKAPPLLGADSKDILVELGYSASEITGMIAAGITADP